MSGNVKTSAQIKAIDPVWEAVRAGAQQILDTEPSLGNLVLASILNHDTFEEALAHRIAARLDHEDVSADIIRQGFAETLRDSPEIGEAARADLAATLERDGIRSIGQLQKMERGDLMRRYGTMGDRLYRLARGEDDRRVEPRQDAKSVSAETTFDSDLGSLDDLVPVLRALSEKVSARLKKAGIAGRTVVLKLKSADFRIRTRNRQLGDPTRLADRIFSTGLELLRRETDGTKYRLLGIGVSDLSDDGKADPPDLVDVQARKRAMAEGAIDALRDKFGRKAVETGYTFGKGHRGRPARPDEDDGPEVQHPWERI